MISVLPTDVSNSPLLHLQGSQKKSTQMAPQLVHTEGFWSLGTLLTGNRQVQGLAVEEDHHREPK